MFLLVSQTYFCFGNMFAFNVIGATQCYSILYDWGFTSFRNQNESLSFIIVIARRSTVYTWSVCFRVEREWMSAHVWHTGQVTVSDRLLFGCLFDNTSSMIPYTGCSSVNDLQQSISVWTYYIKVLSWQANWASPIIIHIGINCCISLGNPAEESYATNAQHKHFLKYSGKWKCSCWQNWKQQGCKCWHSMVDIQSRNVWRKKSAAFCSQGVRVINSPHIHIFLLYLNCVWQWTVYNGCRKEWRIVWCYNIGRPNIGLLMK